MSPLPVSSTCLHPMLCPLWAQTVRGPAKEWAPPCSQLKPLPPCSIPPASSEDPGSNSRYHPESTENTSAWHKKPPSEARSWFIALSWRIKGAQSEVILLGRRPFLPSFGLSSRPPTIECRSHGQRTLAGLASALPSNHCRRQESSGGSGDLSL